MFEIKNSGPGVGAVLVGDPTLPESVKLLQPGEVFHSDAPELTVVDDRFPGMKDRRAPDQGFAGRRVADPKFDQRQIKKAVKNDKPPAKKDAGKPAEIPVS